MAKYVNCYLDDDFKFTLPEKVLDVNDRFTWSTQGGTPVEYVVMSKGFTIVVTKNVDSTGGLTGQVNVISREYRCNIALADYIVPTYLVSEATVDAEYSTMSAAQKATYGMLISMGELNLSTGTAIRDKLWSMFPSTTTTRANLETLVGTS